MSIKLLVRGVAILCLTLSPLMASTSEAQVKSIDEVHLKLEKSSYSLLQLFQEIERKTEFKFFYTQQVIKNSPSLTAINSSGSVEEHLMQVAKQTNLRFKQVNNTISVIPVSNQTQELITKEIQLATIVGTVTDNTGAPMPGVTIVVQGTTTGTVTDIDGKYSIEASEGQVLVFSFIGFQTTSRVVGTSSVLDVRLFEDENNLQEVVVIGYGTIQKKDITGAVSAINADKIKDQQVPSLDLALAGQMAGVVVTQATGAPGGGASVRIRGAGSLSAGNEHLLFIE